MHQQKNIQEVQHHSALPCSMLMMAIPDVEVMVVRLLTMCFNVFGRWHQRLQSNRW